MHNAKERTVTSTYNLATWILFVTYHLIMMIICANLFFWNPITHDKIIG